MSCSCMDVVMCEASQLVPSNNGFGEIVPSNSSFGEIVSSNNSFGKIIQPFVMLYVEHQDT